MRAIKVLLIESARYNGVSFAVSLKRKYDLQIANSGKQGLELAQANRPDVIVLDAVSMRTSGDRICARLRNSLGNLPIIHIRPDASSKDESVADVLLEPPFTSRKLINRIERFAEKPAEGEVLEMGGVSLNLEQQMLVTPHSEKKLTPKLVTLMEMFMRNANQTLARKDIMQEVWNTDYMGDTRTLDVHIRWLRKIVEPNPRKPEFITTVRGVGYRFVVDEETSEKTTESAPTDQELSKTAKSLESTASSPVSTAAGAKRAKSPKQEDEGKQTQNGPSSR